MNSKTISIILAILVGAVVVISRFSRRVGFNFSDLGGGTEYHQLAFENGTIVMIPDQITSVDLGRHLSSFGNGPVDKIHTLPIGIGALSNVTVLSLTDNDLETISEDIAQMSNLREIDFTNNKIIALPMSLCKLKALKRLKLKGNPLEAQEIEKIQQCLPACTIEF